MLDIFALRCLKTGMWLTIWSQYCQSEPIRDFLLIPGSNTNVFLITSRNVSSCWGYPCNFLLIWTRRWILLATWSMTGIAVLKLLIAHLTQGCDCPHLRKPMVYLIIKGQAHHESLKPMIERKASRLPVTIPILKFMKHKLKKADWPLWRKCRLWSAACLLWNGGMRVHEGLSREKHILTQQQLYVLMTLTLSKWRLEEGKMRNCWKSGLSA